MPHTLENCPQGPVISDMKQLLARVAVALEDIAAQGVSVASHEKRLDGHDKNVIDLYNLVRGLRDDISAIQTKHAREDGAEEVIEEQKSFWRDIKKQLTPFAVGGGMFIFYLLDRFDVVQHLTKWWKEMKG